MTDHLLPTRPTFAPVAFFAAVGQTFQPPALRRLYRHCCDTWSRPTYGDDRDCAPTTNEDVWHGPPTTGGRALCFLEPSRPDENGDQVKHWDRG